MTIICFSHLRWNFVYQRPQHILSRFARAFKVFFFEEPVYGDEKDYLEISKNPQLWIIVPHLKQNTSEEEKKESLKGLLNKAIETLRITDYIFWYYTPMSLLFTEHLHPKLIVYDCMDELSKFRCAPDFSADWRRASSLAIAIWTLGCSRDS